MKRIILFTLLFIGLLPEIQANDMMVGKMINGLPTVTIDKNKYLDAWNVFLHDNYNINAGLTKMEIVRTNNGYNLLARGSSFKSSIFVTYNISDGAFMINSGSVSCTTTACSSTSGCEAWGHSCTECSGDCTKTTTNAFSQFM